MTKNELIDKLLNDLNYNEVATAEENARFINVIALINFKSKKEIAEKIVRADYVENVLNFYQGTLDNQVELSEQEMENLEWTVKFVKSENWYKYMAARELLLNELAELYGHEDSQKEHIRL